MLSEILKNQVRRHAEECYPEECCGLITGFEDNPELAEEVIPCTNIQNKMHAENPVEFPVNASRAYVIDPSELLRGQKKMREKKQALRMIYHSHIDTEAYFSAEDLRLAVFDGEPLYPGIIYLICSVCLGKCTDMRFYRWDSHQKKYLQINR